MRFLLSTIGTRGDVQPLLALALELKSRGHEVRMCVPPDFREWIEGMGVPVTPIGPQLRSTARSDPMTASPTPEQRRAMIEGTVVAQFQTIGEAARGCDIIVGATALQIAAPSVAEKMGVPYFFVAYAPNVLPSRHHAPPVLPALGDRPAPAADDYSALWKQDAQRWNAGWRDVLNPQRVSLGLDPIDDVRGYVHTDHPWLAADPTLAPWPGPDDAAVFQTGAWIIPDSRPLPAEVEAFLDAGEPPIYYGFSSIRAPENVTRAMVESARALGRRAIVSRGWADLSLAEEDPNCLVVGEVNVQALFERVAAVVGHGGAGTTTLAARAGAPQVVVAQHYDQHYFAGRVQQLGIGVAHPGTTPTGETLTSALEQVLGADVVARARAIAPEVRSDGVKVAAERLVGGVRA